MNVRTVYAALLAHCDRWLPLPTWQVCPDMLWQLHNICAWAETAARLTFIVLSKMFASLPDSSVPLMLPVPTDFQAMCQLLTVMPFV